MSLATAQKGTQSMAAYFAKMKGLGDELAVTGKRLEDDELISYICGGLDLDYNSVVTMILGKDGVSLSDAYSELLNFKTRLEMYQGSGAGQQFQSSANSASRGRGGNNQRGRGGPRGRGNYRGHGRHNYNTQPRQGGQQQKGPKCQICGKPNHNAINCWHRYELSS